MEYVDRNEWVELKGGDLRRPISGIYRYLVDPTSKSDRRTGERSWLVSTLI
jgi:hypothetical protein